jgi:hypothetical protein
LQFDDRPQYIGADSPLGCRNGSCYYSSLSLGTKAAAIDFSATTHIFEIREFRGAVYDAAMETLNVAALKNKFGATGGIGVVKNFDWTSHQLRAANTVSSAK